MKRVLLICPKFYDYPSSIVSELKRKGYYVKYFDERPSNGTFTKILLRLGQKNIIRINIEKYYSKVINDIKNVGYDILLFVNIEAVGPSELSLISKASPNSKKVLYMWDSSKNKPTFPSLLGYFDVAYSFDSNDVNNYDALSFLPLFYTNEFATSYSKGKCYHFAFVGSGHSDRCNILGKLVNKAEELNLKFRCFIFFQSRLVYLKAFFRSPRNLLTLKKYCSLESLSLKGVNDILSKSNVIVDIAHEEQSGLTMRTIESLGANQKLITTNKSIINYDFYDPEMIHVIDRDEVSFPAMEFFLKSSSYDKAIQEKYSISSWIDVILNGKY